METVFLRNRKLQDLQTSLQICNKICTDRDRAGFCTALQNCNYYSSITEKGGESGTLGSKSSKYAIKFAQTYRDRLCTALQNCNYSCNFTVQNSTQRRVGREVHWATRGRCLQCLVAKILCVFNRLEPVRGAAVVVLLRNRVGTSAPAFCVFCLAPCRQSADRCTMSEKPSIEAFCFKAKVFLVRYVL